MQDERAALASTTRIFLVAVLALGSTIVTLAQGHAGVLPPTTTPTATPTVAFCDFSCDLIKTCSVAGSEPSYQCTAYPGQEVTYRYRMDIAGSPVELWDDHLGFLGSAFTGTRTVTTTLTETTVNTAWLVASQVGCPCGRCDCVFGSTQSSAWVIVVSPTPSPTPTATPTPPPTPTPTPETCSAIWPEVQVVTIAKGQSPTNNAKVSHVITGHLVDPGSVGETDHRIAVCAGTQVDARVMDSTGTPTNTADGSLACDAAGCSGVVNATEKYHSISEDGQDKDTITFLPK